MLLNVNPFYKKFFVVFQILLILWFSFYEQPKAQANAAGVVFAGGLGFIGSESAAGVAAVLGGPVGLGLFALTIGATAYAVYHEEINQFIGEIGTATADGIKKAWDSLSQATKDAWNAAAGTWDATKDNIVHLTKEMANSVVNFFAGYNVFVKALELNPNFPYVATLNNGDIASGYGYDMRGTFTQAEVDTYSIWKANYTDKYGVTTLWAFVPTQWKYDKNEQGQARGVRIWYGWVQKQTDGTWQTRPFILSDGKSISGIEVYPSSLNQIIFQGYNASPMITVTAKTIADAYLLLEAALSQYKSLLIEYATDIVGTWTDADVIDPTLDRFLEKVKSRIKDKEFDITVPAGTITTSGDRTTVKGLTGAEVGIIAQTIPKSVPVEENPGWPDVNNPGTPPMKLVTTRFPFSLPWDIARIVNLLAADPKPPIFNFNKQFMGMPFRFNIDLTVIDPYMPFFRFFLVIGFCIFLITGTRKLLGGGQ